jgi:hypothetical protein
MLTAINYCRCGCCLRLIITSVVVTVEKLLPFSLLLGINYHWCHGIDKNLGQNEVAGVNYTGINLSTVTTTPEIFIVGVVYTNNHTVANISVNFCKKLKWPQWDIQERQES